MTTTNTLPIDAQLSLKVLKDRAYRAMFTAEQHFGHGSEPHVVAWTVFCESCEILDGLKVPRVFVDQAERYLALDIVDTLCANRRDSAKRRQLLATCHEMACRAAS